ncbi:MAG: alginate export family protein [Bacteroidetes bacterium]|nr:alginate export family protein [Bacteroidota bacterium]
MKKTFLLLAFFGLMPASQPFAQIGAELRSRAEWRHGYGTLADETSKPALFISQRSRLNAEYQEKKFRVKLSLQDVRVWGDEEQLRDLSSTALHEAWGEFNFSGHLSLRTGRQELVYDDHRLLGNVDWVQQARSHDAALLKFDKNGWKAHLGGAYNNQEESFFKTGYTLNNYRVLSWFWLNHTFKDKLKFSFTGITDGFQANDTTGNILYRGTLGPHLELETGSMKLKGTFYYQFGKNASRAEISAFMAALNLSYKVNNLTFGAGVDYLSGTDALDTGNKKYNTFNTLYATNHLFYGLMDYFLNIPAHTRGGGLTDIYGQTRYKFSDKTSLAVDLHYFLLSNNVINPAEPAASIDKKLGTEVDAVLDYKLLPQVNLKTGFSVMMPASSMEVLKGGDKDAFQGWGWVMITFKPEFFTPKTPEPGK